jgi:twinkle protein
MSSVCIEKLPHKTDDCGSSNGLQVFADEETGQVSGFCFSCHTYVDNPYGEPVDIKDLKLPAPKTEKELQAEIAEVDGYPTVDIPSRKLRGKHLAQFGIKVALSEQDGKTPVALYHPIHKGGKVTGYYIKTLGEDSSQWSIGDVKKGEPIGWQEAKRSGAYRLIITEGREDAPAIVSIFDRYGDDKYTPAVIALPNGTNSVESSLTPIAGEIAKLFKDVVLAFDDDKSGHEAVKKAMLILPHALSATLPEKDANECIMKGASKAAHKALAFQAAKPKNSRILTSGPAMAAEARIPTPYGEFTWPYPGLNQALRGMRTKETIYLGSGVKMGKSDIVDEVQAHLIKEHGVKVLSIKPEEPYQETYNGVAGKVIGAEFKDPDIPFDYEKHDEATQIIGDKLHILDLYQHLDLGALKQDIIHAANEGVRAVFLDPITNLTAGMGAGDANALLAGLTRDMAALAMDLDMVMFITAHLKAPNGEIGAETRKKHYNKGEYYQLGTCSHERGGNIYSNQFTGSRSMMQACNLMLGLEGNKDPELPDEILNTRWLTILESRKFSASGSYRLYRNPHTTLYKEV